MPRIAPLILLLALNGLMVLGCSIETVPPAEAPPATSSADEPLGEASADPQAGAGSESRKENEAQATPGGGAAVAVPKLPAPTGEHAVGSLVAYLLDPKRRHPADDGEYPGRVLVIQLWYPARDSEPGARIPYFPEPSVIDAMKKGSGYFDQSPEVIESWRSVITSTGFEVAPLRSLGRRPLLLFSHGLGVSRSHYTSLLQDLASHGYLVVSIDHPQGGITGFPGGKFLSIEQDTENLEDPQVLAARVRDWAGDDIFVLDQLLDPDSPHGYWADWIDSGRIGVLGHSMGGAAALEACRIEPRFRACVMLDGAPFGRVREVGLGKPTLVMQSQPVYSDEDLARKGRTREVWEQMGEEILTLWREVASKNAKAPLFFIKIKGTGHVSFSDAPFVMPSTITRFGGEILDYQRAYELITRYLNGFLGQFLLGEPGSLLDPSQPADPEIEIKKFP